MPELSIVLTTWNSLSHIRKCLESILSLDMSEVETIVVDSNSTDGTKEYLEALSHSLEASKLGLKVLLSHRRIKWSLTIPMETGFAYPILTLFSMRVF